MRVRVELRRTSGVWLAPFRTRDGFTGQLVTQRRTVSDRQFSILTVSVDAKPGDPNIRPPGPELFEARITEVLDDQIRFMGWEVTADRAWVVQEWDCYVLPW